MAALMQLNPVLEDQLRQVDHVLPMPLSKRSLKSRGYNQALELACAINPQYVRPNWLIKLRDTPSQSELAGPARLTNLKGALAVEPLSYTLLKGSRLLLIDDVMTTGTTLNTAADMLRRMGAMEVHAAVFARTLSTQNDAMG